MGAKGAEREQKGARGSRKQRVVTGLLVVTGVVAALVAFLLVEGDAADHRSASLAAPAGAGARDVGVPIAPELREVEEAEGTALRSEPTGQEGGGDAAAGLGEAEGPAPHPLDQAKEDLAFHATVALDGAMYINDALDQMLKFASLEVSEHADFDYEDDDAIAYRLLGGPEGVDAWMLVGLQPYEENGETYRYVQMKVSIPGEPELLDGALREGPYAGLSISYDVTDPETPTRFAFMLKRRVDLAGSRRAGIDAYSGRYTVGAYYWHDLLTGSMSVKTTGIVDGNSVEAAAFGGVPLVGNTDLDMDRLNKLLAQLQANLSRIKGE